MGLEALHFTLESTYSRPDPLITNALLYQLSMWIAHHVTIFGGLACTRKAVFPIDEKSMLD